MKLENLKLENMCNLNQMSHLNKLIPLAEVLGGGGAWGGGAWEDIGARGLLYSHANCTYNNHNYT